MNSNFLIKTLAPMMLLGCSNDDTSDQSGMIPETLPDYTEVVFTNPGSIDNPYFGPAETGKTYIYMGGEAGMPPEEEIRIERKTSTKDILGVSCIVQNDKAYLDGVLIEDTDDWLAQDDDGNVWYFGEFVQNYQEGTGNFKNNDGSWEAGKNGALPGYWIPADLVVGMEYHQEFRFGQAEDQAKVVAVGETVTIGLGTYTNCVVTRDFTRFEPEVYELKYYAPALGLIMEEGYEDNKLVEIVELTAIIDNP